jgi:flavin reductase (DIM6/NTAB) family NADH-FMN oxidoreductase RutF
MFKNDDIIRCGDDVFLVLGRITDCYMLENLNKGELHTLHQRSVHSDFSLDKVYLRKKKIDKICSELGTK